MLERFQAHLRTSGLIPPGARVLVGYSGGADSTCLLHLLSRSAVDVVAAYLHHGLRPEADQELERCASFCETLDIPFASGRADVTRMAAEHGWGIEEAGREARYAFFREAAFRLGCQRIATAHTRDDRIETMLMNVTRGCGIGGLAGIPSKRDDIVRPLLPFSRMEARAYCEDHGLWFHDDPGNDDARHSRVRIRHQVLPVLRTINPEADEAIVRLSDLAIEEDRMLDGMAAAALEQSERRLNGELWFLTSDMEVAFRAASLRHLPLPLLRRALRLAAGALGATLEYAHSQSIADSILEGGKGSITAESGDVVVEWDREEVGLRRLDVPEPFRHPLTLPGETVAEEFGWRLVAEADSWSGEAPVRASLEVQLAAGALRGPLYFRSAQAGDTMRPLGFGHTRKLSDLLGEAKLTLAARRRLPIVCDLLGPLWVPGVCLDERARPSTHGETTIRVRLEAIPSQAT